MKQCPSSVSFSPDDELIVFMEEALLGNHAARKLALELTDTLPFNKPCPAEMDKNVPLQALWYGCKEVPIAVLAAHKVVFFQPEEREISAAAVEDTPEIQDVALQYFGQKVKVHPVGDTAIQSLLHDYHLNESGFLSYYKNIFEWHKKGEGKGEVHIDGLVKQMLIYCVLHRGSDIHLEPTPHWVNFSVRVAGRMRIISRFHIALWPYVLRAIKTKADLNTAETRLPQEGRFQEVLLTQTIDCRVSCHPTHHSEAVVIRVLNQATQLLKLESLGLPEDVVHGLKSAAQKEHGLIILTGPTGSGKTTTLYSLIDHIKSPDLNIVTLEDPVEYVIKGVRQSSINPKAGFTMEEGIRSLLRQDPDVMLIGEIRDALTAQLAFRAALTGHLVLTTLHAGSVFGVLSRLLELGVTSRLIAECVHCVVSQRLVAEEGTYKRRALGELLTFTPSFQELLEQGAPFSLLKKQAVKDGYKDLLNQP